MAPRGPSAPLYRSVLDTPIGPLTLVVSAAGVRAIRFGEVPIPGAVDSAAKTRAAARQLTAYFRGRRRDFDLRLDLDGTAFQLRVWRALLKIPYGSTASYGDIARAIGQPKAMRAVGGANRRNPIPIVVPCHRVIGADGAMVGYDGPNRLPVKRFLLDLEQGTGL